MDLEISLITHCGELRIGCLVSAKRRARGKRGGIYPYLDRWMSFTTIFHFYRLSQTHLNIFDEKKYYKPNKLREEKNNHDGDEKKSEDDEKNFVITDERILTRWRG